MKNTNKIICSVLNYCAESGSHKALSIRKQIEIDISAKNAVRYILKRLIVLLHHKVVTNNILDVVLVI